MPPLVSYIDWGRFGFFPRKRNSKSILDPDYIKGYNYTIWTKCVRYKANPEDVTNVEIICKIVPIDLKGNASIDGKDGKYLIEWTEGSDSAWSSEFTAHSSKTYFIPDADEGKDVLESIDQLKAVLIFDNCEIPDPPKNGGFCSPQEYKRWLKANRLTEHDTRCIIWPSTDHSRWEEGEGKYEDGSGEFYLKLEYLGNKHHVNPSKMEKLAQWLKLTSELLG